MPQSKGLFIVSRAGDNRFAMVVDVPITQEGEIVTQTDHRDFTTLRLDAEDTRPLGDCLFILGKYFMISDAAWNPFAKFLVDPEIWRTKVVVTHRASPAPHTFWWLRSRRDWQVIDWTSSKVRYIPGTRIVSHVQEWVLRNDSLPEFDVFLGDGDRWFVSADVRSAIDQNAPGNFECVACTVR
jgi:hypothetical protein